MIIFPCPTCSHPTEIEIGEINECDACGTQFMVESGGYGEAVFNAEESMMEVSKIKEELEHLDDATLLEDCIDIVKIQDYLGTLDIATEEVDSKGSLSPESRAKLEGIYILHFGIMGVVV